MPEITYDKADTAGYQERFDNWKTAIGLQAVDNLKPSEYLTKLAQEHIEGKRSIDEVEELLKGYYSNAKNREAAKKTRQDEADLISTRIAKLLDTNTFTLTENSLKTIHRRLFSDFKEYTPGRYRTYDIVKPEWVLDGDTVQYGHWETLDDEISLLIHQEQGFDYSKLPLKDKVDHIITFTSKIWVQHAFLEGNTRTIALLVIKYLGSIGFELDNQPFEDNSWYFRNALARANYRNAATGVSADDSYLRHFFGNLLLNEHHAMKNRMIHIYWDSSQAEIDDDPVNDPVNDPVKGTTFAVLNQLKSNPSVTYEEIATAIGKSRATVRRAVRELKESSIITRIGSDKTGYWDIKKSENRGENP